MTLGHVQERFQAILTGASGTEYPIPVGMFRLLPSDRTMDSEEYAGLERIARVVWGEGREEIVPTNRTAGFDYVYLPLNVTVGYCLGTSEDALAGDSVTSAGASERVVRNRASADVSRISAAFSSWLNFGGLTPHVIDCVRVQDSIAPAESRLILTITFRLSLRIPLAPET